MKITVTHDDGTQFDITEGVQTAYDLTVNSMDWGSGFLGVEEVETMHRLAALCRFGDFEAEVIRHWEDARKAVDQAERAVRDYRANNHNPHAADRWEERIPALKAAARRAEEFKDEVLPAAGA